MSDMCLVKMICSPLGSYYHVVHNHEVVRTFSGPFCKQRAALYIIKASRQK